MLRLEHNEYLYLMLIIPVIWLLFALLRYSRRQSVKQIGENRFFKALFPENSNLKAYLKLILYTFAFAFLIIGLANPQIGTKLEKVKREGVEVIIGLDVSNSMLAEDIKPNRLERAKQSVMRLIEKLDNDRIGIVAFAGDAFLQLPITSDFSTAKLMLSTLDNEIISTQGTAIGSAIELAKKSFSPDDKKVSRVLIIITDGENHEDDAISAAQSAYESGIKVHTIGMGSIKGAPIPVYQNGNRVDFIKDDNGSIVISKLDASALEQISNAGGGKFIRSASSDPDLASLISQIGKMKKTEFESRVYTDYEDRFYYFLAAALILLIAELFISDTKNKFVYNLIQYVEGNK